MKAAEPKISTPANKQKANQPFFGKGWPSFFSGESVQEQSPFFGSYKSSAGHSNGYAIQTKLTIGQPGDIYEKEADTVADKVVQRLSEPKTDITNKHGNSVQTKPLAPLTTITPLVQTKCATCEQEEKLQKKEEDGEKDLLKDKLQKKPIFESNAEPPDDDNKNVQRKCAECEQEEKLQKKNEKKVELKGKLQKKPIFESNAEPLKDEKNIQGKSENNSPQTASSSIESSLNASKGSGNPLPAATREQMESSFGADFSNVRIHNDSSAVQMSKDLNAQAFTHGSDIYFNEGKYDISSNSGKHLLAHELTHTVQQAVAVQKKEVPNIQKQHEDHLTSLNEMLDRFNVPESDVITQLRLLNTTERTTVLTDPTYKRRMASAFNVGEMVQAVTILNPTLEEKLKWVKAAATFVSSIDYSDIKAFITASATPQTERDALKISTQVGKSFFVDVCTNATMVEALNDLQFDLVTKLTWLKAEVTIVRLAIDYSDIKPWIIHANTTQAERNSLKTNTDVGKDFFVSVCTNATIVEALNDLQFDLVTKLTWLKAEVTIVRFGIDYPDIKPWIIHVNTTQAERDSLKLNTDVGKDFFTSVCNNSTIKDALDDLQFDILTTIQWLLDEASPSNVDYVWLCNKFKAANAFPAGEDVIACAIMERDIRDSAFDTSADHQPAGWLTRAHTQLLVANQMGGMVGQTARWRGSGPTSGTTFQLWASAPAQGPTPSLGVLTVINCWEMVMLAAFRSGAMSWANIHAIYTSGAPGWSAFVVTRLSFNNRIPYNPSSPAARPVAGDIVFFDGINHVALGTGSLDGMGRAQIYSFWPPPNTAFTAGGTIDDVKITTIEELNDYWVAHGHPAFKIEFTTPNW